MEMPEVSGIKEFFIVFLAALIAGAFLGLWYKYGAPVVTTQTGGRL